MAIYICRILPSVYIINDINMSNQQECPICLDIYNLDINKPFAFSCGHIFCSQCVQNISIDDEFECPYDRKHLTASAAFIVYPLIPDKVKT